MHKGAPRFRWSHRDPIEHTREFAWTCAEAFAAEDIGFWADRIRNVQDQVEIYDNRASQLLVALRDELSPHERIVVEVFAANTGRVAYSISNEASLSIGLARFRGTTTPDVKISMEVVGEPGELLIEQGRAVAVLVRSMDRVQDMQYGDAVVDAYRGGERSTELHLSIYLPRKTLPEETITDPVPFR